MFLHLLACQSSEPKLSDESNSSLVEPTELPNIEEVEVDTASVDNEAQAPSRQLKRMTISQVRDSMVQITGVPWGDLDDSNWDRYSETLGVADYQLRVTNDRSPSVMFQKFLDDAATETCLGWLNDSSGQFFRMGSSDDLERENVRTIIIDLRWQIQGRVKEPVAPIVDDYELLFQTAYQRTQDSHLAWQSVCIALFTHPDFFMY